MILWSPAGPQSGDFVKLKRGSGSVIMGSVELGFLEKSVKQTTSMTIKRGQRNNRGKTS